MRRRIPPPRDRKRIGGWTPDKVLSVAKLLDKLEEHPGFVALMELVDARLDEAERSMVYGTKPLAHAEYARTAGQIAGLRQLKLGIEQVRHDAREIEEYDREIAERQTAAEGEAG